MRTVLRSALQGKMQSEDLPTQTLPEAQSGCGRLDDVEKCACDGDEPQEYLISESLQQDGSPPIFCDPVRRVKRSAYRRTRPVGKLYPNWQLHVERIKQDKSDWHIRCTFSHSRLQSCQANQLHTAEQKNPCTSHEQLGLLEALNARRQAYLDLPVEIRYPFNYVANLFEDASPQSSPFHEM
ncbi:unnamed protein product [Echinostoma caproni]|uniref:HYLS1_C domain-containing protein n=1 Tax=Echinostoma caproni TaxID=27848 RepID=A0A183AMM7_9TREM|nr:unnamed protein product [Echinostoma caproni]